MSSITRSKSRNDQAGSIGPNSSANETPVHDNQQPTIVLDLDGEPEPNRSKRKSPDIDSVVDDIELLQPTALFRRRRQHAKMEAPEPSAEAIDVDAEAEEKDKIVTEVIETIYPKMRAYQERFFKEAVKKNIVMPLPTGAGKTLVAAALMLYKYLREKGSTPVHHSVALKDISSLSVRGSASDRTLWPGVEKSLLEKKISVFLVPRVALVSQQANAIRTSTRNKLVVGEYHSDRVYNEMMPEGTVLDAFSEEDLRSDQFRRSGRWRRLLWDRYLFGVDVAVMTHQILLDCLRHNMIDFTRIQLLVFDEAHHATKSHPYRCIMNEFFHRLIDPSNTDNGAFAKANFARPLRSELPSILAMTATPSKVKVDGDMQEAIRKDIRLLQDTLGATLVKPTLGEQSEILKHIDEASEHFCCYDAVVSEEMEYEMGQTKSSNIRVQDQILSEMLLYGPEVDDRTGAIAAVTDEGFSRLFSIIEYQIGYRAATRFWESFAYRILGHEKARELQRKRLEQRNSRSSPDLSPKTAKLIQILVSETCRLQAINNELRCLVFVEMRCVAWALYQEIKSRLLLANSPLKETIRPYFVVGHSSSLINAKSSRKRSSNMFLDDRPKSQPSSEEDKLKLPSTILNQRNESEIHAEVVSFSLAKQARALSRFRSGITNVLISTSVLEEGVDVRECNSVIMFDGVRSPLVYAQTRGRARAVKISRFIVLLPKDDSNAKSKLWNARHGSILQSSEMKELKDVWRADIPALCLRPLEQLEEVLVAKTTSAFVPKSASSSLLARYSMSREWSEATPERPQTTEIRPRTSTNPNDKGLSHNSISIVGAESTTENGITLVSESVDQISVAQVSGQTPVPGTGSGGLAGALGLIQGIADDVQILEDKNITYSDEPEDPSFYQTATMMTAKGPITVGISQYESYSIKKAERKKLLDLRLCEKLYELHELDEHLLPIVESDSVFKAEMKRRAEGIKSVRSKKGELSERMLAVNVASAFPRLTSRSDIPDNIVNVFCYPIEDLEIHSHPMVRFGKWATNQPYGLCFWKEITQAEVARLHAMQGANVMCRFSTQLGSAFSLSLSMEQLGELKKFLFRARLATINQCNLANDKTYDDFESGCPAGHTPYLCVPLLESKNGIDWPKVSALNRFDFDSRPVPCNEMTEQHAKATYEYKAVLRWDYHREMNLIYYSTTLHTQSSVRWASKSDDFTANYHPEGSEIMSEPGAVHYLVNVWRSCPVDTIGKFATLSEENAKRLSYEPRYLDEAQLRPLLTAAKVHTNFKRYAVQTVSVVPLDVILCRILKQFPVLEMCLASSLLLESIPRCISEYIPLYEFLRCFQSGPNVSESYERLEFLGDCVLKLVATQFAFEACSEFTAGGLHLCREERVNNAYLAQVAITRGIAPIAVLHNLKPMALKKWPFYFGMLTSGIDGEMRYKETYEISLKYIADVMEALIGAAFCNHGYPAAVDVICKLGVLPEDFQNREFVTLPTEEALALNRIWNISSQTVGVGRMDTACLEPVVICFTNEEQEHYYSSGFKGIVSVLQARMFKLEEIIGYKFRNRNLLLMAMIHSSCCLGIDYEQLEHIGDAVLSYVIGVTLYHKYPNYGPGNLTELMGMLLSNYTFARTGIRLGLHNLLSHTNKALTTSFQIFERTLSLEQLSCRTNAFSEGSHWPNLNPNPNASKEVIIIDDAEQHANPKTNGAQIAPSTRNHIASSEDGAKSTQADLLRVDPIDACRATKTAPKVLADFFEAIIGAIHLDIANRDGMQLKDIILNLLEPEMNEQLRSFKASRQSHAVLGRGL